MVGGLGMAAPALGLRVMVESGPPALEAAVAAAALWVLGTGRSYHKHRKFRVAACRPCAVHHIFWHGADQIREKCRNCEPWN
jgi:hypothetical protein